MEIKNTGPLPPLPASIVDELSVWSGLSVIIVCDMEDIDNNSIIDKI